MACKNLTDFKPQIEDRFTFWDEIRNLIDGTRLELKAKIDVNPEWLTNYPEDKTVLHDLTMALHQCLIKTVGQYSTALKTLEEMEESEMEAENEKISKHSGDQEYRAN